jgi:hypothetical protein
MAIIQAYLGIILLVFALIAETNRSWSFLGYGNLSGEDYPHGSTERNVQVLPGIRDERNCGSGAARCQGWSETCT